MATHETDVVIVGASLTGLACGLQLNRAGISCDVLGAEDKVGGIEPDRGTDADCATDARSLPGQCRAK